MNFLNLANSSSRARLWVTQTLTKLSARKMMFLGSREQPVRESFERAKTVHALDRTAAVVAFH
jgi:hypothetical protein